MRKISERSRGRMMKKMIALLAMLFTFTGIAWGGEYKWIPHPKDAHGKADIVPTPEVTELCRTLEKNINSLGPLRSPLLCERPLDPKFKDFSKPKWTKLEPTSHIELIKKMDIALNYSRFNGPRFDAANEEQWRNGLQKRLQRLAL